MANSAARSVTDEISSVSPAATVIGTSMKPRSLRLVPPIDPPSAGPTRSAVGPCVVKVSISSRLSNPSLTVLTEPPMKVTSTTPVSKWPSMK